MDERPPETPEERWYAAYFEGDDYELANAPWLQPEHTVETVERCIRWLALRPPQQVLDLCCGSGRHTRELRLRGYPVLGLDLSPYQLGEARKRLAGLEPPPSLVRGDARRLPLADASFEAVLWLYNSFGYLSDEGNLETLREAARVLRPGGGLALEVLNRDGFLNTAPRSVRDELPDGYVTQEVEYLEDSSQVRSRWRFVRKGREERRLVTLNRLYSVHELAALCRSAGLSPFDVRDSGSGEPLDCRESTYQTLLARKA